ncbi:hypothetical protein Syun_015922 [Stephania yunnanensis]|uniref:Uncharacterized protein n=1 Tax=Stephania yunnanensis TaxID=152371 RepID=A0AAP0J5M1_9MAGN
MSASFSPSRTHHGSARLQFGVASQRLRSSHGKKPPEPLRRAVADCLSSSSQSHHGIASDAARTLRDYLAASSTTDLAYSVLIEHALAERDRSPAVVAKCVALLKRYLIRYVPSEQTLLQIDQFCASSISECHSNTNQGVSPWSKSLSQQSGASFISSHAILPSLPVSSFASAALSKSLNYVRCLVARHNPRRSFQPAVFTGASSTSKQALPTLSSLLSRSFNSQLNPVAAPSGDSSKTKESPNISIPNSSSTDRLEGKENTQYIYKDVLQWRWPVEYQSMLISAESDGGRRPLPVGMHSFFEVGAAALLVGDLEAKVRGQTREHSKQDAPDLDRLMRPSTLTTANDFASAQSHLRVITASKRTKSERHQVWEDTTVNTFRPRSRPLFQYRPYSEQQPLRLNPAEVQDVIALVCSDTFEASLPKSNLMTVSSRLSNNGGKPSIDIAVSVLVKLVIDMYVLDSRIAAPLTLSMLEEMLTSVRISSRARAFDLILNLGVHAHLLEPMLPDDPPPIEEECSEEGYLNNERQLVPHEKENTDFGKRNEMFSAINTFETWLLNIMHETLLLLVQIEEKEETVWASAFSCLLYFVCDRGRICRSRLEGLDIRVIKVLLEISRENSWAEIVHCKLICMLTNMFYQVSEELVKPVSSIPEFLIEQIDLLGGIEFICLEFSHANSREEKRNLFLVLFDYVLHQINESCLAAGDSEYSIEEIQPLASLLILADAPEAFHISIKHGVEGIGEILRRSMSLVLRKYPNGERLNMLLENLSKKLDSIMTSFSRSDSEFSHGIWITKSFKTSNSICDVTPGSCEAKLSWTILHSLLHSERAACRQNGYIWLVELLLAEINEKNDQSIWLAIGNLQRQIKVAGSQDYSVDSDIPLSIWIFCGLLKSKQNFIRLGFLFVVEKLLMRCKMLLDENELLHSAGSEVVEYDLVNSRLEKANAVIGIMSKALSLVTQINETDGINILKMCDILFSQLCLKLLSPPDVTLGDTVHLNRVHNNNKESGVVDEDPPVPLQETNYRTTEPEESDSRTDSVHGPYFCKTTSLAALLLQGQATVPMQLVTQVPTVLFDWPLIQLAGAATDNIALGVAVGSKGRGNVSGATSDIRAALLVLLIGKCTADPAAFQEVGGEEFFRRLLEDPDSRVAYYCSAFLLKRMMTEQPETYQRLLQSLIFKAQQSNNEKLLENPYLQIRGILQLSNDLEIDL